jgi:LysR family pca operon transcriptional activator
MTAAKERCKMKPRRQNIAKPVSVMAEGLLDPRIKLRHAACLVEVARQHSVVRAAEALGMTQPGVSRTIKELEDVLGWHCSTAAGAVISMGALPTVSSSLAPMAIERFGLNPMFCRIRVVTGPSTYLLAPLRVGDVDSSSIAGRVLTP